MAANALKKINARAKALKKKHPGKKYKTLQKQAGAEYKAGKLKSKRPAKRKPAKRAARRGPAKRRKARRRVGKPNTVVYSLGKLVRRRRKSPKRKQKTKRRVGRRVSGNSSMMPVILIGLAAAAYFLLKPAAVPVLYQSSNVARNNATNNIMNYATAAGLTAQAIAALINSLNSSSDSDVINAGNNPASAVQQVTASMPTANVQAPTGGPASWF
jgi:hypothetical protein